MTRTTDSTVGFTPEERAAMKEHAAELRAAKRREGKKELQAQASGLDRRDAGRRPRHSRTDPCPGIAGLSAADEAFLSALIARATA